MTDRAPLLAPDRCALIGMIHLPPLLGQRTAQPLDEIEGEVVREAMVLAEAGFNAILIENFGDVPFYPDAVPPHTVSAMTRLGYAVREFLDGVDGGGPHLGINVLRNDARSALAVAAAVGASFVRVNVHAGSILTDQGLLTGRAHETVRYRDRIAPTVAIYADIRVKHAVPLAPRPLEEEAYELVARGRADGLIVTGSQTGFPVDVELLDRVRAAVPTHPVLVGSGVTPEQVPSLVERAHALIVGTWLKEEGDVRRPIDPERARKMAEAAGSSSSDRGRPE